MKKTSLPKKISTTFPAIELSIVMLYIYTTIMFGHCGRNAQKFAFLGLFFVYFCKYYQICACKTAIKGTYSSWIIEKSRGLEGK